MKVWLARESQNRPKYGKADKILEGGEDKLATLNQMQKAPLFEKTGAREFGAGLLEISKQATELVDEIATRGANQKK